MTARRNKYGNKKTELDGILFDSKREATRFMQLRTLHRAGVISNLQLQVPFALAPAVKIKGRMRPPLKYIADFVYQENGSQVVEDAKGHVTEGYRIKRHLMVAIHGVEISEV